MLISYATCIGGSKGEFRLSKEAARFQVALQPFLPVVTPHYTRDSQTWAANRAGWVMTTHAALLIVS